MDESRIKKQLKMQTEYINEAKKMADRGFLERTALFLTKAKLCKDTIYGLTLDLKPGINSITQEIMRKVETNQNHYYIKETKKIFSDGECYCMNKLEENLK